MSERISISELRLLSPEQRLNLVEALWDSLVEQPDAVPVTDAQKHELDARLEAYERDSDGGANWNDVRDRIAKDRE